MAVSQTSCGTCGTEPRAGARFCDACGSPIASTGTPSEHKQVTVLFADVVRSMDLAGRLDSERLREVMSELFNRCGAIVQRYGGTVDKFTGDGIMAIFGAPIALEDHAARACLAALEIQREVRRLVLDVHRRDGVEYALRVGLNSGAVVTGQIGVDPTSYTAVGAQVGLAQRMESVAPAGGVMVSESTARLVEHTAVLGDPQLVEIKGSVSPIPARLLKAMGPRRWPQLRHESALVGRDSEIASIAALLDDALAGHGHVISVSGPPGIGKSRIGRELAELADTHGVKTYSTFCESHARDMPFLCHRPVAARRVPGRRSRRRRGARPDSGTAGFGRSRRCAMLKISASGDSAWPFRFLRTRAVGAYPVWWLLRCRYVAIRGSDRRGVWRWVV